MFLLLSILLMYPSKHGAGADIFTANMYLAEDRVRFFASLAVTRYLSSFLLDFVLGVGIKARWIVDLALCQVSVCRNGCTRPSTFFSTTSTGNQSDLDLY